MSTWQGATSWTLGDGGPGRQLASCHSCRAWGGRAEAARKVGADHVVVSTGDTFVTPVLELTGGEGVHAVFDGGGQVTFRASMRVLRRHGTLLYYGTFIGEVPVVSMRELPNSIKICYPVFRDHIPTHEALLSRSQEIFSLVRSGQLKIQIGGRLPLHRAPKGLRRLPSHGTTRKAPLLPCPELEREAATGSPTRPR